MESSFQVRRQVRLGCPHQAWLLLLVLVGLHLMAGRAAAQFATGVRVVMAARVMMAVLVMRAVRQMG